MTKLGIDEGDCLVNNFTFIKPALLPWNRLVWVSTRSASSGKAFILGRVKISVRRRLQQEEADKEHK